MVLQPVGGLDGSLGPTAVTVGAELSCAGGDGSPQCWGLAQILLKTLL